MATAGEWQMERNVTINSRTTQYLKLTQNPRIEDDILGARLEVGGSLLPYEVPSLVDNLAQTRERIAGQQTNIPSLFWAVTAAISRPPQVNQQVCLPSETGRRGRHLCNH